MRRFKAVFQKRLGLIIALFVTVQAICLCCVSVVSANNVHAAENAASPAEQDVADLTERLGEKITCAGISRSSWLYELMRAEYGEVEADRSDSTAVFEEAKQKGIISYYTSDQVIRPLTRRFVASTLVKACGYEERGAGMFSDVSGQESYLNTAAYYGYFLPDMNNRIYPDAHITADEFAGLKRELECRRTLKDKRALSFGDSIMYGSGNNGEGIGEMLAEKYGMTCTDYAIPGATMGVYGKRGHIPDEIRQAIAEHKTADVIFLNGGTNDMLYTKLGKIADGYEVKEISEKDYSGGFEKCMWLIKDRWGDVPVIYIRAHNMALGKEEKERQFGERALELAEKWDAVAVDLYSDSSMNTENPWICSQYTCQISEKNTKCDSIHPTALGYAKFYMPPASEALMEIFGREQRLFGKQVKE